MSPSSAPAIALSGVCKAFGAVRAVDGIDLTIDPGEVVAFLGPNGAGKTTTLDMVLGLSQPTAGTVAVAGLTPRQAVDAGRIAAVTQTGGLLGDVTVGDHVRLIAALFGVGRARAEQVMAQCGVDRIAHRKVQVCSGGERQRLKFAMALVPNPDLMVLDEPTTGMDVQARRDFWADLHARATAGRTVVFATHYLEEADQYADRVVVIQRGRIVADGTTAQVRALASGRTVTATFPTSQDAQAGIDQVAALTTTADLQGAQATVRTRQSDAVARAWLTTTGAHDLVVSAEGLEDAFLELTRGSAS
jgi:ABC-2 type transport system ATP-binding protein